MTLALEKIDLLLLDVDGVLTDGSITYSDGGEELKTFHARDGLGLAPAHGCRGSSGHYHRQKFQSAFTAL